MEHEVYVPHPVGSVRAALAERARVTRCVPGLRQAADGPADTDAIEGRLRVRVGGSTITYRGSLEVGALGDGFAVRGGGVEARGQGSVRLELEVVPRPSADGTGTRLTCSGSVTGAGRIADVEPKVASAAGRRMLDRFADALAESLRTDPLAPDEETAPGAEQADSATTDRVDRGAAADAEINARRVAGGDDPKDNDRAVPGIPEPERRHDAERPGADQPSGADEGDEPSNRDAPSNSTPHDPQPDPRHDAAPPDTTPREPAPGEPATDDEADPSQVTGATGPARPQDPASEMPPHTERPTGDEGSPSDQSDAEPDEATTGGVFDVEVPPPSLDPYAAGEMPDAEGLEDVESLADVERTTAEAAHARRTMIGRSAEEVDHAPPRGRYAPEPLPDSLAGTATLRWAAPAAALVVAGAIVLGRALRRRR